MRHQRKSDRDAQQRIGKRQQRLEKT